MSDIDGVVGTQPEQQTLPTDAARGKSEVDRSVPGTDLRSGFAKLRRSVEQMRTHAQGQMQYQETVGDKQRKRDWECMDWAYKHVLREIDELSECEG